MGVLCVHSPKIPGQLPKLPKKKFEKNSKIQKKGTRLTLRRCRPTTSGRPQVNICVGSAWSLFLGNSFSPALHFLRKWSSLDGWFPLIPALPKVQLKTSNTHNF
jgi:hypothetical protein